MASQETRQLSSSQLDAFAADHAISVLSDLLDFRPITIPAHRILRLLEESYSTTYPRAIAKIEEALHLSDAQIKAHADTFVTLCKTERANGTDILADDTLMERARKGAKYFDQKVSELLDPIVQTADFSLDNSQADQQLSNLRNALAQELQLKHALLNCVIDKGFNPMSLAAERALAVAHESSSTKTRIPRLPQATRARSRISSSTAPSKSGAPSSNKKILPRLPSPYSQTACS